MDQEIDKRLPEASGKPVTEFDSYSRQLLAAIVSSSDDAIISKDLNGVITSWNEGAYRIFGYSADEIIGQSIFRLIPEDLHYEEIEILKKLRAGERISHHETVRVRKNGERFEISLTISPVRDDEGRVIGASKIGRDVTGRRRADDARFRLAAIVDSADDAIISKNLNGIVMSWNEGARRMFGYTAQEMIGQPILRLIPDDLQYEEDEILSKIRAGERIDHYETVRVTKNGESREVSVTISPMRDDEGRITGASKIARDISDRKRMEKALMQSEKIAATGRMAAAIAHEINNPLESLMNLIFLARKSSPVNGEAHGYLMTAESELDRVSQIARQTLGYYRDSGSPSEVHLHELIEGVLVVYQTKLAVNGITIETSFDDVPRIAVSRGEIIQVFSNIIANSIEAMRRGGKLSVHLLTAMTRKGEGVQIVIRDEGSGIAPEHIERIFEPFFTTKGNLGTGIGLWVAKQLIERRGGQIAVASSTEPGKNGTSITIYIPFEAPAPSEGRRKEPGQMIGVVEK